MRKFTLFLISILLLTGCERPATSSSWSPINPTLIANTATIENTPSATSTRAAPIPTLNAQILPTALPHLMKGYELVSWQTDGDWNFTLITGTNRSKSFEELISPESHVGEDGDIKLTVRGVDEMMQILDLLPAGESVSWGGMNLSGQVPSGTIYFSYPPQAIMDQLFVLAKSKEINLFTLQEAE